MVGTRRAWLVDLAHVGVLQAAQDGAPLWRRQLRHAAQHAPVEVVQTQTSGRALRAAYPAAHA